MKKFLFTGVSALLLGAAMPLSASPLGVAARLGEIAFARDPAIYLVNPAGSAKTRLRIVSPFGHVSWDEPAWSPDGQKLALLGRFDDGTLDHDNRIYVRGPSGHAKDLTVVGAGTGKIAWSPDGKRLAVGTGLDEWRLALVNVATGKTRLVSRFFYGDDPAWSPDGAWICFRYGVGPFRDGEPNWRGLAVVRPNGRGFRRLAIGHSPSWSPNGKKIAFAHDELGIAVINSDGSHLRRVTTRADDGEPAWSPSGAQVVFTRLAGYRSDLWIMRRDGSHQVRLIANGYSASWRPRR